MDFFFVRIPRTGSTSICKALGISHEDHKSAQKWKSIFGDKWDKLFKFTIVRNPYDWALSILLRFWRYSVEEYIETRRFEDDQLFIPQYTYIYNNGKCLVDYVGKFESLEDSFKEICKKIGVTYLPLPHESVGDNKPFLSDFHKKILYNFYKKDFDLFGYERGW